MLEPIASIGKKEELQGVLNYMVACDVNNHYVSDVTRYKYLRNVGL